MLLQTFIKMRKNYEKEDHRPKEFVRNIDIGTGFKCVDDSDVDDDEPASAAITHRSALW